MKLIMLPLLISAAYLGYEHRGEIVDQYFAAYPSDPVKAEALNQCASSQPNFNRLDAIDRDQCYSALAVRAPVGMAPVPSPSYAHNPSHLPGNDIRRQEASDTYRLARAAAVTPSVSPPVPTVAAPHRVARNNPTQ
jgi:hypothetical protein